MRRGMMMLALALSLAVPAWACSQHGTTAGNDTQSWLDSGSNGLTGNNSGFSVEGSQSGDGNADGNTSGHTWNAHDSYWVTVTLPSGTTITITADAGNFTGGGEVEDFLSEAAANVIQQTDVQSTDYIG